MYTSPVVTRWTYLRPALSRNCRSLIRGLAVFVTAHDNNRRMFMRVAQKREVVRAKTQMFLAKEPLGEAFSAGGLWVLRVSCGVSQKPRGTDAQKGIERNW